ncbi:MAG: helix-turn-helix transcriptional regulator [Deltaproteobacteria bacterium]|nr:helix-turn-helix transcriptional regulator [Deltaproteobacteria bacterium]MBW2420761.1 helix-turn-helix transcriptional regulator [Deltaproteobacteria bacterium]
MSEEPDEFVEVLTEREQEIAACLARGARIATVARDLHISEHTVRNHLKSIFAKLGTHSQVELVERVRSLPSLLGRFSEEDADERGRLAERVRQANLRQREQLDQVFVELEGLDAMRTVIRAVLPLDEARQRDWRLRLKMRALHDPQQLRDVLEVVGWGPDRPLRRIQELQREGAMRPELDPAEVYSRLRDLIHAAVMGLLEDPSEESGRRYLERIDTYLESLAPQ